MDMVNSDTSDKTDKFLIKNGSKLKIVSAKQLETLTSNQILVLALSLLEEQRQQLMQDATSGTNKQFYGRNIVDALELSLRKLEEKFPDLRQQAQYLVFGKTNPN